MTPEKKLEKRIHNSDVHQEKDGHWSRVMKCSECGNEKTVHSGGPEDLIDLENYECVECRGVLKKFEKEKPEE